MTRGGNDSGDTVSVKPWLTVGYVARAHGLKGALVVKTYDPASSALGEVERVQLALRTGELKVFELSAVVDGPGGDLLVEFFEVDNRDAATGLVGATVSVHRDEVAPPADGELFQGDLVGLIARTVDGRILGSVVDVWSAGPVPNLVIKAGSREEMIPFAQEFVVKVDLAHGTIVLNPPEYDEADGAD